MTVTSCDTHITDDPLKSGFHIDDNISSILSSNYFGICLMPHFTTRTDVPMKQTEGAIIIKININLYFCATENSTKCSEKMST